MSIPFWLLQLLPMWEYICPKCKKEVAKNSHNCPHCGEKYPLPLKIPPTILKDSKKLEEYVHKHIFPRVSAFERAYLTKFFTEIFSDGFESGNFNAWTGTVGTPTVTEGDAHHGTYKVVFNNTNEYCYKTFTEQTTPAARVYFKTSSDVGDTPGNRWQILLLRNSANGDIVQVSRYNNAGTKQWQITSLESGTWANRAYSFTPTFSVDTWYCLEIGAVIADGAGGEYHVYFDGVENTDLQRLSKDTNDRGNINQIRFGMSSPIGTLPNLSGDCVVVADAYIGEEEEIKPCSGSIIPLLTVMDML